MKIVLLLFIGLFIVGRASFAPGSLPDPTIHPALSEFGFFQGAIADLTPAPGVVPYDLNTALFSDYAHKKRFIRLPEGTKADYKARETFQFPTGTILIKNFYYPNDFRNPEKGRRIIETRLLVKGSSGWTAWPYIWNKEQTEASLDVAGDLLDVKWVDGSGKKRKTQYLVPSTNQCKGCHTNSGQLLPIGPAARHLNRSMNYGNGEKEQLIYWKDQDLLKGLPPIQEVPRNARSTSTDGESVDSRARAWLDINCGHCHSPGGSGSTSGLLLDIYQTDPTKIGINKTPVAAGRGSGKLDYDIVPGHPERSILLFRMISNDPGIRMPEIGRTLPDQEGIDLISQWIKEMK